MVDGGEEHIAKLRKEIIVPVVYSIITSEVAGETIAAALAVDIPQDRERTGVFFEASGTGDKEIVEERACRMVEEALSARGVGIFEIMPVSAEIVIDGGTDCAASAALLLP